MANNQNPMVFAQHGRGRGGFGVGDNSLLDQQFGGRGRGNSNSAFSRSFNQQSNQSKSSSDYGNDDFSAAFGAPSYQPAFKKTASQSAFSKNNAFGQPNKTMFSQSSSSTFGQSSTSEFNQPSKSAFGQSNTSAFSQPSTSTFGQSSTSAFGQPSTSAFGQSSNNAFGQPSTSAFGQPSTGAFGQSSTGAFGQSSTGAFGQSSTGAFGQPSKSAFGQPNTNAFEQPSKNAFEQPSKNAFEQPSTSAFGQPSTSAFGQPSKSAFGQASANVFEQPSKSAFGQASANVFEQPSKSAFGQASANVFEQPSNNAFSQPSTSAFAKSNKRAFNQTSTSAFSQPSKRAFGKARANTNAFEQPSDDVFDQSISDALGKSNTNAFSKPSNSVFSQPNTNAFIKANNQSSNAFSQPSNTSHTNNAKRSVFSQSTKRPTFGQPKSTPHSIASSITGTDISPTKAILTSNQMNGQPSSIPKGSIVHKSSKKVTKSHDASNDPRAKHIVLDNRKDAGKMTAADRAQRFGSTSKSVIYDKFKKDRVRERQQAIQSGQIPDPSNPTRLEDAIDFRGTCQAKCPDFEMIEREIQNGLDALEMDEEGNADPEKCVKAYRRSAAGNEQPLPSDVRTPEALVSTLDYLVNEVLSSQELDRCHAFIRDRTRSIRQDFTLQNIRDITAVQVHERIARFHILCLHEMCEYDESKFSEQQETEQLRKVLLSLMEFYDDLREDGIDTPNEAEFRAYHMLSHIRDQDIARQAQTLPIHVFRHPYMMRALEFHALAQRNNEIMETSSRRNKPENIEASQNFYSAFFKLISDGKTPFLMACMLECHFADVRKGALKAMNVSYMIKAGGVEAEHVRKVLGYDSIKQLIQEANLYGIVVDTSLGVPTICFGQKHYRTKIPVFIEPLSNPSQKKSMLLVEPKKSGRSFREIINGERSHTDATSTNVFQQQTTSLKSQSGMSAFNQTHSHDVPTLNFKLQELTEGEQVRIAEEDAKRGAEQIQKQRELEAVRARAEAAEAQAALERKKMEAIIEKKRQEEAAKEEKKRQEQQRREEAAREEQRQKQQQREQQQQEQQRQMEAAREQQRQEEAAKEEQKLQAQLLRQQRDKQVADMHRQVVMSQMANRYVNELMNIAVNEKSKDRVDLILKTRHMLKRKTAPWLKRARSRIEKRDKLAIERNRMYHFSLCVAMNNPYSSMTWEESRPLHVTPEGIRQRVEQSMQAEKYALENISQPLNDHQESIWKTESFSSNIYPRIKNRLTEHAQSLDPNDKPRWQLMVSVDDKKAESSVWFHRKFGFDNVFDRKLESYKDCDIVLRMIDSDSTLPSLWVDEMGALIFSLPESKSNKTPSEIESYWAENKKRLDKLMENLQKYNPGIRVPILFTYFPDSTRTGTTLENIPSYLGLERRNISDYHFLIMNPLTIAERIVDEVNWLSRQSACK